MFWRKYWKGWLEAHPDAWTRFLAARDEAREDASGGLRDAVAVAEAGRTGIEGFDDWAEELVATGYLHNHARVWVASIWIFTLRLPWVLGADFFLRYLVDADPASNTSSWRWVAGLQTKGKTYLATSSNIARYTDGRFEPRGLARTAEALSEPALPKARPVRRLPAPPVGEPALLLVTPDDLSPETFLSDLPIAGVTCVRGADAWPWGSKARIFVEDATEDSARRAQAAFSCQVATMTQLEAPAIVEAAQAAGARQVITAFAPVGRVADALAALETPLVKAGLPLTRVRRSWDEKFWPHATKGFFALKKQIRDGLAEDGLAS